MYKRLVLTNDAIMICTPLQFVLQYDLSYKFYITGLTGVVTALPPSVAVLNSSMAIAVASN